MKRIRKIDELYREKLRNVEITPPEDSLDKIFSGLKEEKKDRRISPLWYKIGGAAAALALLFILFNLSGNVETNKSQITTAPVKQDRILKDIDPVSNVYREAMLRTAILLEAIRMGASNNQLADVNRNENSTINESTKYFAGLLENPGSEENSQLGNPASILAETDFKEGKTAGNSSFTFIDYMESDPELSGKKIEEIAVANMEEAQKEEPGKQLLAGENVPEEEIEENSALKRRFSITTTAAAVYFDNLGSGNALANQFANRESSGEVSMAYGVNLAYQLSEKIKVRTGLSKVNLSHNTKNVDLASAARLSNVDSEELSLSSAGTGYLNQSLGFIEVPLEMEYALLNKKIGLNLIGGASTFFLDRNMVSMNAFDSSINLGEANNLNQISFSTNIGLGFNYNLSPQFQLNLEPIFKYQINTFENSPGLNPYFFGIYSGLNFKF